MVCNIDTQIQVDTEKGGLKQALKPHFFHSCVFKGTNKFKKYLLTSTSFKFSVVKATKMQCNIARVLALELKIHIVQ